MEFLYPCALPSTAVSMTAAVLPIRMQPHFQSDSIRWVTVLCRNWHAHCGKRALRSCASPRLRQPPLYIRLHRTPYPSSGRIAGLPEVKQRGENADSSMALIATVAGDSAATGALAGALPAMVSGYTGHLSSTQPRYLGRAFPHKPRYCSALA